MNIDAAGILGQVPSKVVLNGVPVIGFRELFDRKEDGSCNP